jgi:hypothetical protein
MGAALARDGFAKDESVREFFDKFGDELGMSCRALTRYPKKKQPL